MSKTLRFILKNKSYVGINLFGLTLAFSVCIFILLYVQDEFSYDRYLPGYDRIIRIQPVATTSDGAEEWATSEGFLVPAIASMYPEVESGARILRNDNEVVFRLDSTVFAQDGVIAADSTFFNVFPFTFIYGDPATAFKNRKSIVITQEVSRKFFGNVDPVGKVLSAGFGDFEVTGVVEDVPVNSHFHFKVALPLKVWFGNADESRNMYAFYSYLRIRSSEQTEPFIQTTLLDWYSKHAGVDQSTANVKINLVGRPVADIHLQSHAEKEYEANSQLSIIYLFIAVGVLIMAIATINYINLSNAVAINRSKEVGIKKTIGASRHKLFRNFLAESYGLSFLALVLGLATVALLMPSFNTLTGKQFAISVLLDGKFLMTVFSGWLVLGFLAGFYPATILASFNPIQALKSQSYVPKKTKLSLNLRRSLIVFQFSISSFMIVGAFTIQQQLQFINTRDNGFKKENVLFVPLVGDARQKSEAVKTDISALPSVESASITSVVPGKRIVFLTVRVPDLAGSKTVDGEDGITNMRVMAGDHDVVKTLGLQIIDGRDFSIENAADVQGAFLLNEAAVKEFNLKDPVGRPFEYLFTDTPKKGTIVGVVKDFNFASIHTPVEPLMIHIYPQFYSTLCIRLSGKENVSAALTQIENTWKKISEVPFSYQFLDATYDSLYRSEKTMGRVISYLTIIALVIACLGLFGIVSFFIIQRTREVGIRKVFGATRWSLLNVLSREYVYMVIIGNLIAVYPAWLLANQWLQQFSYRIEFSFSIFVIAFLATGLLAASSIFYIIQKTANSSPIKILRTE
jgi:putative ABC transport system permease protein